MAKLYTRTRNTNHPEFQDERVDKAEELVRKGYSIKVIAPQFGLSKIWLAQLLRDRGIVPHEIQSFRRM